MHTGDWKPVLELSKTITELLAFLAAFLYFSYKLLAGFYVLSRLTVKLSCETPFPDKGLLRMEVKLTNRGSSTLKLTDGWLRIFALQTDGTPVHAWTKPQT